MRNFHSFEFWGAALLLAAISIASAGCSDETAQQRRDREDRLRQEAADAAAKAKPALENAGKELDQIANRAADDARATAQGVKEGWDSTTGAHDKLDLNSASESDLLALPGINKRQAHRIVEDRPYRDKHEIVTRRIITEDEYLKIRDQIAAH
jgi:DNA uptake protein ComE-like DNA-binding protein